MYYNDAQKTQYLEDENNRFAPSTLEVAKMIFSGSADVESQEDTDLSNFNRQQVVNLLKKYNSTTKGYLKLICIIFSDYYNWCMKNDYIDSSNFTNWYDSKLSKPIIDEIVPVELVKDKYFTKEDVYEYLEKVPDVVNKFLIYALFRGIDGIQHDDLKHLSVIDLHEKRNAIQLKSGRIQYVDELFVKLMKNADAATVYLPEGKEVYNVRKRYNYDESIYVFRFCNKATVNQPISNQAITVRMSLIKKQTGNKFISASTLYFNGLVNYIKEHYSPQGITLDKVLFENKENNKKLYKYDEETQDVIKEYGSKMEVKMLRLRLKDFIKFYL